MVPGTIYSMDETGQQAWSKLERAWNEIRRDRIHGAGELLNRALGALNDFFENLENPDYDDIEAIMNDLANLRGDMAGFSNCVRLINTENIETLMQSVIQLREYLQFTPRKIADGALSLFTKPVTVMTNSRSSVVQQVVLHLHSNNRLKHVIQMESRPALEGRTNAEHLLGCGVHVTVIPDAALGYWVNNADAVFVGADAIAVQGNFLGKIGCLPLAVLAHKAGVPFYVAADRLKFVQELPDEYNVNRNFTGEEINWGLNSDYLVLSNIIYEITPGELVTGYLTEYGLQQPPLTVLETLSF
jgi:translation initiation factor eIF-2B subunit delta